MAQEHTVNTTPLVKKRRKAFFTRSRAPAP